MGNLDINNIAQQYEEIYESSLLRKYDQVFQRDVDVLKQKFQTLCNDPSTQEIFEKAKSEKGQKYLKKDPQNHFKIKVRFRSGVNVQGEKSFLMIKIYNAPQPNWGAAWYQPDIDSICFTFYLEGFVESTRINQRFTISDWYKHHNANVENIIAHELSHMYKSRFHMRKPGSPNLVTPQQVKTGEKNSADYAMYNDEKESYLAEIWNEMLACNASSSETFDHCLLQSSTFKRILKSFGVSSYPHRVDSNTSVLSNVSKLQNLDKGYRELYNYFMKKLHELWQDKGFKFNDFNSQMYTHKLQQFAVNYDIDSFNQFTNDEKIKALQTDIILPVLIYNTLDNELRKTYLDNTPTLDPAIFAKLTQSQQQEYTLKRYKKISQEGIRNDLDVTLLKRNKRLYDVLMLPEIKKAKKQEQEIRSKLKGKMYEGDIRVESKYVLPDLSDLMIIGKFDCSGCHLTSLKGAPKNMTGTFDCSRNYLKTLEFAPKIVVSGDFNCSNNQLISLLGSPQDVQRNFYCSNNHLKDLRNGPKLVEGDMHFEGNPLDTLDDIKMKFKGIFFSNQFSDEDFKNRLIRKESISFKQFYSN